MKNTMKKRIILLALAVLTAGGVFAQKVGDTYTLDGQPYSVQTISGDTVTLKKVQAQGIQTFTSIDAFKTWFDSQSANTAASPYNVKINISDLGASYGTRGSLGSVLDSVANRNKYVNLDLSGSTFTSIRSRDFADCKNLTGVTIPNSVTSIESSAFMGCSSITSISIPNRVTSIGNAAFSGTGLTSVTIPNSVTIIDNSAFGDCTKLTSVTIGSGVTSIVGNAFRGCTSLTSVTFQGTISSSGFVTGAFQNLGDIRTKFYASNSTNGTPGTYRRTGGSGTTASPYTWTKQ